MGFIREPKGVDFVIAPSQTVKEDVVFINNYIQEYKAQIKTTNEKDGFRQSSSTRCS